MASPPLGPALQKRQISRSNTAPASTSGRATDGGATITRRTSRLPTLETIQRVLTMHATPSRPIGRAPGLAQGLKTIVCTSWLNVFLVFIPVSWALNFALPHTSQNDTLIFIFSFLAIMPLAQLLSFATEELSLRLGQTMAGLLNATLGNAVELIVAIIALIHCELQVVQSSLVGSILSNLLLVLGMCFFAGGTRFSEQGFGAAATQLNASLLTVSVIAVLLPAAFHFVAGSGIPDPQEIKDILSFSHGVAIILLFIYFCYLYFQLFSHKQIYEDSYEDVMKSKKYKSKKLANDSAIPLTGRPLVGSPMEIGTTSALGEDVASTEDTNHMQNGDVENGTGREAAKDEEEEEGEEIPKLSVPLTIGLLLVVTALVGVTAEWLVDSINGLTESGKISKEFVGLILLPIVGNAAEHVTAVTVSYKDKITLSLGVAVGSSIQIALFVIPFIVTLGWIIGKPLSLLFDPFESIVLFLSVIVVNYCVQDGKSNWLEGMILMCLYVILAVTFWYYPGVSIFAQC